MPPQLQQLLQDKRMLAIIGGGVLLVIIIIIVLLVMMGGKKEGSARALEEKEMVLATVDSAGKAIEIQALMARQGLNIVRKDVEGGKAELSFEKGATLDDKDRALITLVQSGLMDKNIGLETFDKGDLTASREEKRIKLIRARNGELSRLIRKIPPIQDASVFISMPEPTMFKRDQAPISATVQVNLNPGERLTRDQVRTILNLLVGSIEGLSGKNVALSDTNGNVYNSVLEPGIDLIDRLEERDRYMEQKVKTQLDRLIGIGKYSVTVSTMLREAPKAEMELSYSPKKSAVMRSSLFNEDMSNSQRGEGMAGGPTSSYVPEEIDSSSGTGEQSASRSYNRGGREYEYSNGKKQVTEDFQPGMIEDISVAVTVNDGALPPDYNMDDFKALVANAASPIVQPESVSVVFQQHIRKPINLDGDADSKKSQSWWILPWWVWAVVTVLAFFFLMLILKFTGRPPMDQRILEQQEREIQQLRELAQNQATQIQVTQQQAQQVMQQQQEQLTQLQAQQQAQPVAAIAAPSGADDLKLALAELQRSLVEDKDKDTEIVLPDEDLESEIKSWIETT